MAYRSRYNRWILTKKGEVVAKIFAISRKEAELILDECKNSWLQFNNESDIAMIPYSSAPRKLVIEASAWRIPDIDINNAFNPIC